MRRVLNKLKKRRGSQSHNEQNSGSAKAPGSPFPVAFPSGIDGRGSIDMIRNVIPSPDPFAAPSTGATIQVARSFSRPTRSKSIVIPLAPLGCSPQQPEKEPPPTLVDQETTSHAIKPHRHQRAKSMPLVIHVLASVAAQSDSEAPPESKHASEDVSTKEPVKWEPADTPPALQHSKSLTMRRRLRSSVMQSSSQASGRAQTDQHATLAPPPQQRPPPSPLIKEDDDPFRFSPRKLTSRTPLTPNRNRKTSAHRRRIGLAHLVKDSPNMSPMSPTARIERFLQDVEQTPAPMRRLAAPASESGLSQEQRLHEVDRQEMRANRRQRNALKPDRSPAGPASMSMLHIR